ncbi:xylulose kinase [Rhodococcus sp. WMMA185]|uniref:xylulokinase n=1 Tax=Rhodococcus sp. WMMA185 TaxID=679318 RepID=UPI0008784CAD|nr:FGGY family carbohydrate kinase [Rhodococcus sp. WMMA185]AOW94056.1 xylulose kinase [Rhodococcus sp. WMMA185]
MTRPVVLGIDSSTQSCKAEIRDADTGALLASGSAPHTPAFPPCSEQDPRSWWDAMVAAVRTALSGAGPVDVRALSVAAQCHGLVLLGSDGQPLRPAKLWNDTTGAPQLSVLVERIGGPRWVRRIGTLPTAAFTIAKLAWVAEHEPSILDRTRHILLPHDYLVYRLTGRAVTDRSDASGTGYFDATTSAWLPDYLEIAAGERDWLPLLPTVLGAAEPAEVVSDYAAAELGLTDTTLVGAGAGDQHAAYLGLGLSDGDQYIGLGTSGVVATSSRTPVFDATGTISGVADTTGGYLPLVCTLNAARVGDTAARILGTDHAGLSTLALAAGSAPGPVLVPFLDGERTPNRPNARGLLSDITSATTREEMARAFLEGPLLSLLDHRDALRSYGLRCDGPMTAVGGGTRSRATLALLADLSGDVVTVPDAGEASARGACVQAAAVCAGTDVEGMVTVARRWAPPPRITVEPRDTGRDIAAVRARWAECAGVDTLDRARAATR